MAGGAVSSATTATTTRMVGTLSAGASSDGKRRPQAVCLFTTALGTGNRSGITLAKFFEFVFTLETTKFINGHLIHLETLLAYANIKKESTATI
jgi:hypothetical protein